MEPDPDEHSHPGLESLNWDAAMEKSIKGQAASAKYSKLSEGARQLLSEEKQCSLFCGGRKCKYCNSEYWSESQMAIKGLYSSWVTDNILAMARPNTEGIQKHKIIEQFKKVGIMSVVNVQKPGEHSSCGGPLDPSGFSYDPQDFMDNKIFFYNFGWPDYGVASLSAILDMVKVMQFAVSQGKVAVHCHAGLGRTGVLICCYLVFTNRMEPDEAIHYIRSKRPNAVQTRGQIQCIQEFGQYLKPLRVVFASRSTDSPEFTFYQYLNRQKHILHGFEARRLKFIPKLIYVICERLLELAGRHHVISRSSSFSSFSSDREISGLTSKDQESASLSSANQLSCPNGDVTKSQSMSDLTSAVQNDIKTATSLSHAHSSLDVIHGKSNGHKTDSDMDSRRDNDIDADDEGDDESMVMPNLVTEKRRSSQHVNALVGAGLLHPDSVANNMVGRIGRALSAVQYEDAVLEMMVQHEENLNAEEVAWKMLSEEPDPYVLSAVLWDWLNHLKEPVLHSQDLSIIFCHVDDPEVGLQRLEKGVRFTLEYLLKVLAHLQPLPEEVEDNLFECLLSYLTHQTILHDPTLAPRPSKPAHWGDMRSSSTKKLFHFFYKLLDIIEARVNSEQKNVVSDANR